MRTKSSSECPWTEGIKRAIIGGVNSVEHCSIVDDETVNLMKDGVVYKNETAK